MWSRLVERDRGERAISEWIRIIWEIDKNRMIKGEMMWIE